MGDHVYKWCDWPEVHTQNIQTAHTTQYQKNKQANKKKGRRPRQTSLQRGHTDGGQQADEKCSTLLIIRETQSKLQRGRSTSYQSERPSSESLQTNAGGAVEQSEPSHTAGGNAGAATVAKSTAVPQNLERELPYDPATSLQDKHAEESEKL